ncbi:pilus assembly protein [Acidovorax sp. Root219]|uniref:pilus assembly protein n=1 Tax=Acidovorax sp. Root219 TaxID=1736493 RepID=UPI0009E943B6|nr:PilC/PilY family type IV pilus protein [Acidovorax sp. Root219]
MKNNPIFKKTILCAVIGSMCAPYAAFAAPLDLSQLPPGLVAIPPTPNVVVTVDDSGSMGENIDGAGTPVKITALKAALADVFNDKLLLPDGKIRLAWQVMWNNGGATGAGSLTPGAVNSMKILDDTHRTNFLAFAASLKANNGTPSHRMMKQTYDYMKTAQGINSPWASKPGTTELPYMGCRRSYQIFMTDGGWNGQDASVRPGNTDNNNITLPDGTIYDKTSAQTNVYRGAVSNLLADWAMKMWSEDLQTGITNDLKPSTTDGVQSTETFGAVALQRYWNPKHNPATWQHVVQYTIGYGKDAYSWPSDPTWDSATDDNYGGDYSNLIQGTALWSPTVFGDLNANNPAELWHMAINSRGKFYPTGPGRKYDLKEAFRNILENINLQNTADVATMGASASTNIRTDVSRFVAGFEPKKWSGYVYADTIKTDGSVSPDTGWGVNTGLPAPKDRKTTAQKLDALPSVTNRVILTTNDLTNQGVSFEWETGVTKLSAAQKLLLDTGSKGEDRVNFLRGDRTKEEGTTAKPFRVRDSRQGDIVNSSVWYTASPSSNYPHKGYKTFTAANRNRLPMIYVGGNDGMLHGFSAVDGEEKIAYIPKAVIPELYKLSDPSYAHRAYVDGSPFTGDVDIADKSVPGYAPDWRTMLVGSLGAGGKGYFVLNVTQPGSKDGTVTSDFTTAKAASAVVLDRTLHPSAPLTAGSDDEDIGHIFAPPVMDDVNPFRTTQVALMNDNRWAVVMGNGYNSKNERPVLLIQYLDGNKALKKIVATGAQVVSSPVNAVTDTNVLANGLSAPKLLDFNSDGKVDVAYAGDLKGNLWKFDLTSKTASDWKVAEFGGSSKPLFVATYVDGKRQPISAPPIVKANDRGVGGVMVAFGTGVNVTDAHRISTEVQSMYSVHDNTKYKQAADGTLVVNTVTSDNGVVPVAVSGRTNLVKQEMETSATGIAGGGVNADQRFWKMSDNAVNYDKTKGTVNQGWYFDFQVSSERVLKPMSFFDGSNNLMVWSVTPAYGGNATGAESCEPAGTAEKAYLTLLNIMDGKRPSVQVMDTNGDGIYNKASDGLTSRMTIDPGASSATTGKKTISIKGAGNNKNKELARMPEQPMRPSWRQLQ